MAQLDPNEIRKIEESIKNINSTLSSINRTLSKHSNSNNRNISQKLNSFTKETEAFNKSLNKIVNKAISGSGTFFRTEGFNDFINKQINKLNEKANKLFDDSNSKIRELISNLDNLNLVAIENGTITKEFVDNPYAIYSAEEEEDDNDSSFAEDKNTSNNSIDNNDNGDSQYNIEKDENDTNEDFDLDNDIDSEEENDEEDLDYENEDEDNDAEEDEVGDLDDDDFDDFVDSLTGIIEEELLNSTKNDEEVKEEEQSTKEKRKVIRKNTPLDTDEIKNLYIQRNPRYNLNLSQLNQGIQDAGTNVDKNEILKFAMYAKLKDDMNGNDFFYVLNDVKLLLEFNKDDKTESLNLIFLNFLLYSTGYSSAHSKALYRDDFDQSYIDPRLCSYPLIDINGGEKTEEELYDIYINGKYVNELFGKLPKPFFDVKTCAKIMLIAYKNPDSFLKLNNLGFRRIN